jgi:hypothetical protein
MSSSSDKFDKLESASAHNFVQRINNTNVQQVIYLSGIVNEDSLSKHLAPENGDHSKYWYLPYDDASAGIIVGLEAHPLK